MKFKHILNNDLQKIDKEIKRLNIKSNKIGNNIYLNLWHVSNRTNSFKKGTQFYPDKKTANMYAKLNGEHNPITKHSPINSSGVKFDTDYLVARKELFYNSGVYN